MFSGLDFDIACAVLLPQVCLVTRAKVIIFCLCVRTCVRAHMYKLL
jgi:hypothetical protein